MATHVNEFVPEFDGTGEFSFVDGPGVELVPPEQVENARASVADLQADGLSVTYLEPPALENEYPGCSR